MPKFILSIVALLSFVSPFAIAPPAYSQTGMQFYNMCGNAFSAGFANRQFCHSYITGIINGLVEGGSDLVCLPPGVTDTQLVMVVQNYMRAHPQELNDSSDLIIERAAADAFPCPTD